MVRQRFSGGGTSTDTETDTDSSTDTDPAEDASSDLTLSDLGLDGSGSSDSSAGGSSSASPSASDRFSNGTSGGSSPGSGPGNGIDVSPEQKQQARADPLNRPGSAGGSGGGASSDPSGALSDGTSGGAAPSDPAPSDPSGALSDGTSGGAAPSDPAPSDPSGGVEPAPGSAGDTSSGVAPPSGVDEAGPSGGGPSSTTPSRPDASPSTRPSGATPADRGPDPTDPGGDLNDNGLTNAQEQDINAAVAADVESVRAAQQGVERGGGRVGATARELEASVLRDNTGLDESDVRVVREGDSVRAELTQQGRETIGANPSVNDVEQRIAEQGDLPQSAFDVSRDVDGFNISLTGQAQRETQRASEGVSLGTTGLGTTGTRTTQIRENTARASEGVSLGTTGLGTTGGRATQIRERTARASDGPSLGTTTFGTQFDTADGLRRRASEREQFGDNTIFRVRELDNRSLEQIVEDAAGGIRDVGRDAGQGLAEFGTSGDGVTAGLNAEGPVAQAGAGAVQGVFDVAAFPLDAALVGKELGEYGAQGVNAAVEGRGGEFGARTFDAAQTRTARLVDAFEENPTNFGARFVTGAALTGGVIRGASYVGGARAGRTVSAAIQPGEELVRAAARSGRLPTRAATVVPGVSRRNIGTASGDGISVPRPDIRSRLPDVEVRFDADAGPLELNTGLRQQLRRRASGATDRFSGLRGRVNAALDTGEAPRTLRVDDGNLVLDRSGGRSFDFGGSGLPDSLTDAPARVRELIRSGREERVVNVSPEGDVVVDRAAGAPTLPTTVDSSSVVPAIGDRVRNAFSGGQETRTLSFADDGNAVIDRNPLGRSLLSDVDINQPRVFSPRRETFGSPLSTDLDVTPLSSSAGAFATESRNRLTAIRRAFDRETGATSEGAPRRTLFASDDGEFFSAQNPLGRSLLAEQDISFGIDVPSRPSTGTRRLRDLTVQVGGEPSTRTVDAGDIDIDQIGTRAEAETQASEPDLPSAQELSDEFDIDGNTRTSQLDTGRSRADAEAEQRAVLEEPTQSRRRTPETEEPNVRTPIEPELPSDATLDPFDSRFDDALSDLGGEGLDDAFGPDFGSDLGNDLGSGPREVTEPTVDLGVGQELDATRDLDNPTRPRERDRTRFEFAAPTDVVSEAETENRIPNVPEVPGDFGAPPERFDFGANDPGDDDGLPRRFRVAEEEFDTGFADAEDLEDLL